MLVSRAICVEREDLENKTWWLERGEKRELLGFFVIESSEISDFGVDGRLGGDIAESEAEQMVKLK